MKDFRELKVWDKSHKLTLDIYKFTQNFPQEERFGLTNQIRRSCSSISANIAEGCGRKSDAEFAHFLNISMGSANELNYHLLLAHDLNFIKMTDHKTLMENLTEIKKMLRSLMSKLRANC